MATKKKDGGAAGGGGREGRARGAGLLTGEGSRPGWIEDTGVTSLDYPQWAVDEVMSQWGTGDANRGAYEDGTLKPWMRDVMDSAVLSRPKAEAWAAKTGGTLLKDFGHDGYGVSYDLANMSRDQVAAAIDIPKEGFRRGSLELTFKGPKTTVWIRSRDESGTYSVEALNDSFGGTKKWKVVGTMRALARAKAGADQYEMLSRMGEYYTDALPWNE